MKWIGHCWQDDFGFIHIVNRLKSGKYKVDIWRNGEIYAEVIWSYYAVRKRYENYLRTFAA